MVTCFFLKFSNTYTSLYLPALLYIPAVLSQIALLFMGSVEPSLKNRVLKQHWGTIIGRE